MIDWPIPVSHVYLLTQFLRLRPMSQCGDEHWEKLLGEPVRSVLSRLVGCKLLAVVDLPTALAHEYTIPDLKRLLQERSLPVSGKKSDLVARLVDADLESMRELVRDVRLVKCTDEGAALANEYLRMVQDRRDSIRQQVAGALSARDFRHALALASGYFQAQLAIGPNGVDLNVGTDEYSVRLLGLMFDGRPSILGSVSDAVLETLRVAAGTQHILGENDVASWLLDDLETGLTFNNQVAANMVLFHALHRFELQRWRETNVVSGVQILTTDDSCPVCKKMAGKKYRFADAPELPNPKCTSEHGCRCTYVAVVS